MCHMGRDASHGFQERQLLKSFFFAIKFSKFDYIIFAYLCKIFSFRQISTFFTICVIDHFTSVKCYYCQVMQLRGGGGQIGVKRDQSTAPTTQNRTSQSH